MSRMKIKRPTRKTILQIILVILVIFAVRIYQQQELTQGLVPSFSSKTPSGEVIESRAASERATLVRFWASWCKICHIENANVETLIPRYRVINIALQSGSDEEVLHYAQENSMSPVNIVNDQNGSLARLFGVQVTPSSFVLDPQGRIVFREVGYVTTLGYHLRLWWAGL